MKSVLFLLLLFVISCDNRNILKENENITEQDIYYLAYTALPVDEFIDIEPSRDWEKILSLGDRALPALSNVLQNHRNSYVRYNAVKTIVSLKSRKGIPILLRNLESNDEDNFIVKWMCAWGIQEIANENLGIPHPGPTEQQFDFKKAINWAHTYLEQ